eukprot:CAMPEP_0184660438 /NCGR_PEP_ID=MMETSP0308-20130426/33940_1 /TAXON_ID=38269 /ORGANISM="Gloeochaete witrockiana, Strain SAG 46.84" /LENGTH=362 /DNA_ID=CAMNT_0027101039 /DNA_START=94 /DNA_END=1182 /DNA_ORIENTATION=-
MNEPSSVQVSLSPSASVPPQPQPQQQPLYVPLTSVAGSPGQGPPPVIYHSIAAGQSSPQTPQPSLQPTSQMYSSAAGAVPLVSSYNENLTPPPPSQQLTFSPSIVVKPEPLVGSSATSTPLTRKKTAVLLPLKERDLYFTPEAHGLPAAVPLPVIKGNEIPVFVDPAGNKIYRMIKYFPLFSVFIFQALLTPATSCADTDDTCRKVVYGGAVGVGGVLSVLFVFLKVCPSPDRLGKRVYLTLTNWNVWLHALVSGTVYAAWVLLSPPVNTFFFPTLSKSVFTFALLGVGVGGIAMALIVNDDLEGFQALGTDMRDPYIALKIRPLRRNIYDFTRCRFWWQRRKQRKEARRSSVTSEGSPGAV